MTVSVEYASEHLPDLLAALDQGEHVEITRHLKPAVMLALQEARPSTVPVDYSRASLFGCMRGKIWMSDDWDSSEVNAQIAYEFLNGENDEEHFESALKLAKQK